RESLERGFGPGAQVLDHLRGRDGAEACAVAVVLIARQTGEKACREEIACASCIDEFLDWRGRNGLMAFARNDDAALFTARHGGELHLVAQRRHRSIEVGGLIEAFQLRLICENEVDRAV